MDMKNMIDMNIVGEFTWMFSHIWFIETGVGNFIWSDPNYECGDNSLKTYIGDYSDFSRDRCVGRLKGTFRLCDKIKVQEVV